MVLSGVEGDIILTNLEKEGHIVCSRYIKRLLEPYEWLYGSPKFLGNARISVRSDYSVSSHFFLVPSSFSEALPSTKKAGWQFFCEVAE